MTHFRIMLVVVGAAINLKLNGQTFVPIQSFAGGTNGANPVAGLILSGDTLYGTTVFGGYGTVFAVKTNGNEFTILHSFTAELDGANPSGGVIISNNILYGVARAGGTSSYGTVFKINIEDKTFTVLHWFPALHTVNQASVNSDGASPAPSLTLAGTSLFGTAPLGGTSGNGTVFKVNTDSTGFTNLHSFTTLSGSYPQKNTDGANPYAALVSSGNTLYGTTTAGGNWGIGTVFAINSDGSSFTNLHSFSGPDGASPDGGLVISGNTLFGTTTLGGASGNGTLFRVETDGTCFTNLYNFTGGSPEGEWYQSWRSGLVMAGNTLYGTTEIFGNSNNGTVFAVNTDGSSFTNLYGFGPLVGNINTDGANPVDALLLSGNVLYGTTSNGGSSGYGTIFSLSLTLPTEPQLTITAFGINVVLAWPTNVAGFNLQATTVIGSQAVWTNVLPGPVIVDGQNVVTNPIAGSQVFYRLSQ